MFLLKAIDLIALIGLLAQAFLAWVFVAILATLRRGELSSRAFNSFFFAFIALAGALTAVSVRFFQAHDLSTPSPKWLEGAVAPTICYVLYQGLKGLFGLLLMQGSFALAGRRVPWGLAIGGWTVVGLLALSPFLSSSIEALLVLQAPAMVAAAAISLAALASSPLDSARSRVVRWALGGLALSWTLHGFAASAHERFDWLRPVLAMNSFLDLGVQLALGTGLVVGLLQENHRRLREAEQEQARLARVIERDEKLRALGTLVSGVAHELNNPLTVILGYSDLIASQQADSKAAKIVAEQAERCRGIVRNLSALAGQSQHAKQNLSMAELVQRVLRGMDLDQETAGRLRVGPMEDLPLSADRIGMEQVLSNLVTNALQADPSKGVVRIDAEKVPEGLEFSVTDEGPGVPADIRPRLFEPFFTTKGPGRGTGLGLSIAHAIVRAHGGSISVEDGPGGRGALFRVTIPHADPSGSPAGDGQAEAGAGFGEGRKLLVIDDESEIRAVVRQHARLRGWEVFEADGVESALALAVPISEFDALLCDLRMPGLGGAGLHDKLERLHPATLRRTVFFTGDLASEEALQFSARCRQPLVQKPFELDRLFAVLSKVSDGRGAAAGTKSTEVHAQGRHSAPRGASA